jgi:hypothetical protein
LCFLPEKTQPLQNIITNDQNGQDEENPLLGSSVEVGLSVQMVEPLPFGVVFFYGASSGRDFVTPKSIRFLTPFEMTFYSRYFWDTNLNSSFQLPNVRVMSFHLLRNRGRNLTLPPANPANL